MPLWAGAASQDQASRVMEHLPTFEYDHGLASCERGWDDGSEHNFPTGWPYSHWYVCYGLRGYGYKDDAARIAMNSLRLIADQFEQTGAIRERHNVVDQGAQVPGRYPPQRGFAWTNGVYAAMLVRMIFGVESVFQGGADEVQLKYPKEWAGEEVQITLPSYPWPDGVDIKQIVG